MLSQKNPEIDEGAGQDPIVGLGLRRSHYDVVLADRPQIPFWELITDNYLHKGGVDFAVLEKLRSEYPIYLHGVGLSLGSTDPLNEEYLRKVRILADRFEPAIVSDHLSWGSVGGRYFHDLLPLTFTKAALDRLSERIGKAQELLGRPLIIENISSYVRFQEDESAEWDFVRELVTRTGVKILLDVNNVFVNSVNFDFDPYTYLEALPPDSVAQIHVAGAKKVDDFYLDDHGSQPAQEVLELLRMALSRFGRRTPVLLEWDNNIPDFQSLLDERERIISWIVR